MGGNTNSKLGEYEQDLSYLDINRVEMKMFYTIFCKMATIPNQDFVTVSEILKYANIPYSHFAARTLCCGFCYVSETESEENERDILASYKFDFLTFVFALWNILTLCPKVFTIFIFSVYDADGGGTIDPQEAQTLLKDLHGDDFARNLDVVKAYNKFAMLVKKNINLEKFQKFAIDNPKVFFPAVELQKKLSACVLGSVYWFVRTKKRKQLYGLNYKHVTRVVDKVRITREREMELDWGRGGKGNNKYILPKSKQKKPEVVEKKTQPKGAPQNVLVLDSPTYTPSGHDASAQSEGVLRPKTKVDKGFKHTVSFADDVNDHVSSTPTSVPSPAVKKSSSSKYFFGSRPNTPSKQISYFLEKFYEKPGEVKVAADSSVTLTPYSLINTGRQKKSSAMPSVQAVIDGNYMMKAEKEKTASAIRLAKEDKQQELRKSLTDVRSFSRGQDFLKKQELKEKEKKPVRKLTKAQMRMIKTKEKRAQMMPVDEAMD